jgi:hypothetical protein
MATPVQPVDTDMFIREHSGWPGVLLLLLAPVIVAVALDPAGGWAHLVGVWHVFVVGATISLSYWAGTARWGTGAVIGLAILGPMVSIVAMVAAYATGWLGDGWGAGAEILPYAVWASVCVIGGLLIAHARNFNRR